MQTITIGNLDDLKKFAHTFAGELKGGDVVGLVGDLGAGKTTFVQMLAAELGVAEQVKSPTFIVMQVFNVPGGAAFKRLCHVDAYRLKDHAELASIGFEEYAGARDCVTVVEWADRVPELHDMPNFRELTFSFGKGGSRLIRIQ